MLVSVVIPTLNEAESIAVTVGAAQDGYGPGEVEVIVVDGGSLDSTLERVPAGVRVLIASPGRGVQLNRGAAEARGEILVFCHGDAHLPQGWRADLLEALGRPGVVGGSFAIRYEPAFSILRMINLLPPLLDWRLMFGDQAQFMTRVAYDAVGGYPEIASMEDLEMMRRLHGVGRLAKVRSRVTASSRRFRERGAVRQMWLNIRLVLRYLLLGASAERIAREYYVTARDRQIDADQRG